MLPPLVCSECGAGMPLISRLVMDKKTKAVTFVVDASPLWCPTCLAKRAKPNPYLVAQKERKRKKNKGEAGEF